MGNSDIAGGTEVTSNQGMLSVIYSWNNDKMFVYVQDKNVFI